MRTLPVVLCALVAGPVAAQGVLVAPHAVFIDARTRSGWIQLHNPGTEPTEVRIEALYGYPVTDSAGNLSLHTLDTPGSTEPSAVAWIRAYPRQVVVPPQGRQTIRLLVSPPAGTPTGEYWARIAITAKAGAIPVTGADTSAGISVGLALEVRTVIPLVYRQGQPTTGVALDRLRAEDSPDSVIVRARLRRTGQAALIGTVVGTLVTPAGQPVDSFSTPISVYHDLEPRFSLARRARAPGRYRLRVEVRPTRTDIAQEYLLASPVARDSIDIVIR